jgi:UDP-glucose 4-epimerase
MANYLVTGAAGFIGAAVSRKLIELGNKVTTIDNLSTGFKDNVPKGVKFIKGDCQDIRMINKLKNEKFDAILHIAGQSSGEISFDDPVYDLQTNVQSTLLLLKYAKETGCKKFVYASSMSVYGEKGDGPAKENDPCECKSFYAVGKLASENYMRIYSQFGISSVALRLFNVYGPGQNMKNLRQGMVSIYLAMALKDKNISVKGSPDRFRDFVFIDDVVDAFLLSIKSATPYEVFNVATGVKTEVKKLIESITSRLDHKVGVEYSGKTPGDIFGVFGKTDKIQSSIGWKPKVSLNEGLDKMINWAKSN